MSESVRKVGPYRLIEKIGQGAFGVVWLAEKQTAIATTKVALKLSRNEEIDLEAFKQEAAIWVQASGHPNVLPMIDADIYDDQLVIVSEYVSDGSLAKWLKQRGGKAPSIESACEMIDGVLAGLAHLHRQHIIHRDLKPDNILLQQNTPRLADFGIARLLRTGSYSTNISGTLVYMAPEAFDGKRNERTDLWSVGVIFYQLLAGRLPFDKQDMPSLVAAIFRNEVPPLPASVPDNVQRIVRKALRREPDQRYASASEMRQELREAQRSLWAKQHEAEAATTIRAKDIDATQRAAPGKPSATSSSAGPPPQRTLPATNFLHQGGGQTPATTKIPNHLGIAILTVFCCWPLAIPAIIFASQVNGKLGAGDVRGAQDAARYAKTMSVVGIITGVLIGIIYLVMVFFGIGLGIWTDSNNANQSNSQSTPAAYSSPVLTPTPTPTTAQLQVVVNTYLKRVAERVAGEETDTSLRKTVYGDVDGDGNDDAVVQFVLDAKEGNSSGIYLAVFLNLNGTYKGMNAEIVGGNHLRDFELDRVEAGKITGTTLECNGDDFPCQNEMKRQAVLLWKDNKIVVPDRWPKI